MSDADTDAEGKAIQLLAGAAIVCEAHIDEAAQVRIEPGREAVIFGKAVADCCRHLLIDRRRLSLPQMGRESRRRSMSKWRQQSATALPKITASRPGSMRTWAASSIWASHTIAAPARSWIALPSASVSASDMRRRTEELLASDCSLLLVSAERFQLFDHGGTTPVIRA